MGGQEWNEPRDAQLRTVAQDLLHRTGPDAAERKGDVRLAAIYALGIAYYAAHGIAMECGQSGRILPGSIKDLHLVTRFHTENVFQVLRILFGKRDD